MTFLPPKRVKLVLNIFLEPKIIKKKLISGVKNRQIAPENLVHKLHHSGGGEGGVIQKLTEPDRGGGGGPERP